MKKIFYFLCAAVVSAVIISASLRSDTPQALVRVVTHVDVYSQLDAVKVQRHYNTPEKVESVLLYLRLLKPRYDPELNPDRYTGNLFRITLHFSDGSTRVYQQRAHRLLSRDGRPWLAIDPAKAAGLYALLAHYPSDPEQA